MMKFAATLEQVALEIEGTYPQQAAQLRQIVAEARDDGLHQLARDYVLVHHFDWVNHPERVGSRAERLEGGRVKITASYRGPHDEVIVEVTEEELKSLLF